MCASWVAPLHALLDAAARHCLELAASKNMPEDKSQSFDELFKEVHSRFPNHLTPHGWYILTVGPRLRHSKIGYLPT